VSWNDNQPEGFLWSDTVWVFVDYNKNGVMTRLPVTSATATAGTVTKIQGNDKGVWMIGNARSAGNFSATVKLHTATADLHGVCAYASNYPPVGEYIDATQIKFTGTPIYKIVVEKTGGSTLTDYSDGLYTLRPGYIVQSFTDATGAPGIMNCMLPATYTLQASASSFCAGSAGVQFTLSGTENGRRYQLYRDDVAVDDAVLEGDGSADTFNDTFNEAGTYTAQTIADKKYCAISMDGAHAIAENPLPANPISDGASRHCPGTVTLIASSSPEAVIDWYAAIDATTALRTGASYTTPAIDKNATYYAQARIENTGCLSARVPVLAEIITAGCCHEPGVTGVTFAAFNPCVGAPYGSNYTLTDDRDQKTYKVKYIPDGRYWMVQNLAFGERCETKTSMGGATTAGNITASGIYYGDCFKASVAAAGYIYNLTAAMNIGIISSSYYCTGTTSGTVTSAPSTCPGICPSGWHIPTLSEWQNMDSNIASIPTCTSKQACLWTDAGFNAIKYDPVDGNSSNWYQSSSTNLVFYYYDDTTLNEWGTENSNHIRCIMNY
jgi:uncharacterized protein (TIGR02145 family)